MSVETLVARAAEAEANLDLVKALDTYEEALKLEPDSLEIAGRLAVLAFRLNMWPMAEKFYAHLITHGIHEMAIITGYAAALREQSKYDEAVDVLKTVLNQRPEEASLWEGLGTVMAAQGDTDNALTFFNEALRLEPDNLHARFNRGCALIDQGNESAGLEDLAACADAFDDPDNLASAQIAYAQALLASGQLEAGWRAYEGRERYGTARQVHYSLWSRRWRESQPIANSKLLVSGEQGLGDEVLFASILPDLIRDIGPEGALWLAVEPRLKPLFQRSFPEARVIAHRTQTIDGILQRSFPELENGATDGWAVMGDFLPLYRQQVSDFPTENAFLKPDPARVKAYLGAHPETRAFMQWMDQHPLPASFAVASYYGINAFRFTDHAGAVRNVRWSTVPEAPFEALDSAALATLPRDFLFDDIVARLKQGPARWHLLLTVGEPGDPTDDATKQWPDDRRSIDAGILTVDRPELEEDGACRDITFDPLILPSGIAPSDDPLLAARSAAYSTSLTRRAGEPAPRSALDEAAAQAAQENRP